jgi:hypothetical protein
MKEFGEVGELLLRDNLILMVGKPKIFIGPNELDLRKPEPARSGRKKGEKESLWMYSVKPCKFLLCEYHNLVSLSSLSFFTVRELKPQLIDSRPKYSIERDATQLSKKR